MGETTWSVDGEEFKFDTLGEVLEYLYEEDELLAGRIIYFGIPKRPAADSFITADDIIDIIGDRAFDVGGEYADDFPDVSSEANEEMKSLLSAWCNKHIDVNFWQVRDVQEYAIKVEDLADYPELTANGGEHAHD